VDFAKAGLLDGLTGAERTARERLLEQLAGDGFGVEELKAAVEEDRLALLPVERLLEGPHSAREIEHETGAPAELVLRIRRLVGLPEAGPDDHVFAEEDMTAARSIRTFLDAGFDEQAIAEISRVLGEAMGRVAATISAAFTQTFLQAGDSEEDVAVRFAALAEQLTPAFAPVLVATFRAHLHEAVSRGVMGRTQREAGGVAATQELAVCFADLVGFTRLGGQLEIEELGGVAGRLGELANEVVKAPTRLIKTIGDAAMFVSSEPSSLIETALSFIEAAERAELPALRAGIAFGPTAQRAGDYFGHSINLASRVTGAARPGSVLCTRAVRDAASDDFDWSSAGRFRFKGVAEPEPLYRARRLEAASPPRSGRRRKRAAS
jgi:adenylate cyclase